MLAFGVYRSLAGRPTIRAWLHVHPSLPDLQSLQLARTLRQAMRRPVASDEHGGAAPAGRRTFLSPAIPTPPSCANQPSPGPNPARSRRCHFLVGLHQLECNMHKDLAAERLLTEIDVARLNNLRGEQLPPELVDTLESLDLRSGPCPTRDGRRTRRTRLGMARPSISLRW